MTRQLELQLFAHGQIVSNAGVMDIEKIDRATFKLTYWNCVGCVSAVGIYRVGKGVHLIDCANPYDNEADKKVVEAMREPYYYAENFGDVMNKLADIHDSEVPF